MTVGVSAVVVTVVVAVIAMVVAVGAEVAVRPEMEVPAMFCYARPRRWGFDAVRPPQLYLVRESCADFAGLESVEGSDPHAEVDESPPVHGARESDAVDESDALDVMDALGDEIALLAAHIHAATQQLLVMIARFDRSRRWEDGGHRSCAHWLSYRTGFDLGSCREKVRTARVLEGLPETSAAMSRGELSFSAVRALTRVATAENEAELLPLATGCTIGQLERMVRGWKHHSRVEESEVEQVRHESRSFSVFPDDDGMYVVKGRLPAEVGALLMRALDAASDTLYRENPTDAEGSDAERRRRSAQRRADSIALVAECALAAHPSIPISGTRAERYQVVLHVDAETLSVDGEPGRSHLEDGTRVSAETSRRLSCDSGRVIMTHAPNGAQTANGPNTVNAANLAGLTRGTPAENATPPENATQVKNATQVENATPVAQPPADAILSVGRKTRTISPALRRALDFRDRGCRFPGCGMRFTDAHHIKHWADGGETSLSNCLLLCGHHHRLLHEGGWQVTWWGEGNPCFFDPLGGTHFSGRWKAPILSERPVDAMIDATLHGAESSGDGSADGMSPTTAPTAPPAATTASARWKREADIPDDIYFTAMEAIG